MVYALAGMTRYKRVLAILGLEGRSLPTTMHMQCRNPFPHAVIFVANAEISMVVERLPGIPNPG